MTSEQTQASITSLTQEISLLTEGKQQWEVDISEALGHIQALKEYASVLRTTLSQVEATVALLQEHYANRLKALFDEPMDELRRNVEAIRDDFDRSLREDIVPSSPQYRAIPERLLPMCVLLETYAEVNSERMRLPPDVMEGIIPMVGLGNRVFYRQMTPKDFRYENIPKGHKFSFPGTVSAADLSSILRQHNWCAVRHSKGRIIYGANFYNDSGDERMISLHQFRDIITVDMDMDETDEAMGIAIVENALKDIGTFKRSRLEYGCESDDETD